MKDWERAVIAVLGLILTLVLQCLLAFAVK